LALSWQQRLDAASSEAQIVEITHEFVASLRGDLVERLPASLRPGRFKDANEVASYAFSVVLHRLQDTSEIAAQVQDIAAFFTSAAARLTQITARPAEPLGGAA
jgi:hypothetical protein